MNLGYTLRSRVHRDTKVEPAWVHGVDGYHARLAYDEIVFDHICERGPVRARMYPVFIFIHNFLSLFRSQVAHLICIYPPIFLIPASQAGEVSAIEIYILYQPHGIRFLSTSNEMLPIGSPQGLYNPFDRYISPYLPELIFSLETFPKLRQFI